MKVTKNKQEDQLWLGFIRFEVNGFRFKNLLMKWKKLSEYEYQAESEFEVELF